MQLQGFPYMPDGSLYVSWMLNAEQDTRNIGWLDGAHPFPTGSMPAEALERIAACCDYPINYYRCVHGMHCPLDEHCAYPVCIPDTALRVPLGCGEIRVFAADGTRYAAPNMIYHYIAVHHYRPPDAFIDALLHGPAPATPMYQQLLDSLAAEQRASVDALAQHPLRGTPAQEESITHLLCCGKSPATVLRALRPTWQRASIRTLFIRALYFDVPLYVIAEVLRWFNGEISDAALNALLAPWIAPPAEQFNRTHCHWMRCL